MNGQTVVALILAPIACGLVFGAWLLWGLERIESKDQPSLFVLFLPGMMYGALFEVFVLLPLLILLRRIGKGSTGLLVTTGLALWFVAILINTLATSQLPLLQFGLREVAMLFLPLMLPGLALVLVFVFVAQRRAAA